MDTVLTVRLRDVERVTAQLRDTDTLGADLGEAKIIDRTPDRYSGTYDVTPRTDAQILPTAERLLARNVTVHGIPYHEVSNAAGGKTIIIGG